MEDEIAVPLPSSPELVLGIAICRRERGFSARDRAFLALIAPATGDDTWWPMPSRVRELTGGEGERSGWSY